MNRYYFYKRNLNIREDLKGDLIDFSLSALYSIKAYSRKHRKDISQFRYFDKIDICISTKTPGIYRTKVDSGTDGCEGHHAINLKELKDYYENDGYKLITEREYFRLRKLAMKLIFKHIKFFNKLDAETKNKYYFQNSYGPFYDVRLVSTSEKYNIRNYTANQIEFGEKIGIPMNDLRIDEYFRIFISKDKNYKSNTFEIESSHFNPYYKNEIDFLDGNTLRKDKNRNEILHLQFERLKRLVIELLLDRSSLDISSILPKQNNIITIFD